MLTLRKAAASRAFSAWSPWYPTEQAIQYCQDRVTDPEHCIDLLLGQPSGPLLALSAIRQGAAAKLAEGNPQLLQYGVPNGFSAFRRSLAAFLGRRGVAVDPGELFMTGGCLLCTP